MSSFGPGSGLIILDNVECEGTEGSLLDCPSQDPGNHNCRSIEDAGVFCPGGKWVGVRRRRESEGRGEGERRREEGGMEGGEVSGKGEWREKGGRKGEGER